MFLSFPFKLQIYDKKQDYIRKNGFQLTHI